tara:strand:+ start:245 stop:421 length:177 start_codon:yes stop_codon:yes gene_type:complete
VFFSCVPHFYDEYTKGTGSHANKKVERVNFLVKRTKIYDFIEGRKKTEAKSTSVLKLG